MGEEHGIVTVVSRTNASSSLLLSSRISTDSSPSFVDFAKKMEYDDEAFISVRLSLSLSLPSPSLSHLLPSSRNSSSSRSGSLRSQQLRKAITPHERYIPPWMTHTAMELRVDAWLQTNWTSKAEEAIEKEPERWIGYVSFDASSFRYFSWETDGTAWPIF